MDTADHEEIFTFAVRFHGRGKGIADLDAIPSEVADILRLIRASLQSSLDAEAAMRNGSPFYLNYVDDDRVNGVAIYRDGVRLIGLTSALAAAAFRNGATLGRSSALGRTLGLSASQPQAIGLTIFHLTIVFAVLHEYAHHFWGHVSDSSAVLCEMDGGGTGGLDRQAQEVIADTFAVYFAASQLLRGDLRESIVKMLEAERLAATEQDRALLAALISAVGAFMALYLVRPFNPSVIQTASHPGPNTRLAFVMEAIRGWAVDQKIAPELRAWINGDTYRGLMRAALSEADSRAVETTSAHLQAEVQYMATPNGVAHFEALEARYMKLRRTGSAH